MVHPFVAGRIVADPGQNSDTPSRADRIPWRPPTIFVVVRIPIGVTDGIRLSWVSLPDMADLFHGHLPRPSHLLLRSKPLAIAVAVAAVAMGVVAAVHPDWLLEVDEPIVDAVRGDALVDFFRFWTQLGSQQDMVLVGVIFAVLLWPRCRPFAVAFPAALLLGVVLDVTLKVIVDRPRPPEPIVGTALGSFPSGHALTGAIFFGLLPPAVWIALRRRLVFWLSVPIAFTVGLLVVLSRVYLGAHWPSDVVASLLIGAAILLATEYLLGTEFAGRHCDGCPIHRSAAEPGLDDQGSRRPA
jgi:membrane-associated phospholipid phosphatase